MIMIIIMIIVITKVSDYCKFGDPVAMLDGRIFFTNSNPNKILIFDPEDGDRLWRVGQKRVML